MIEALDLVIPVPARVWEEIALAWQGDCPELRKWGEGSMRTREVLGISLSVRNDKLVVVISSPGLGRG